MNDSDMVFTGVMGLWSGAGAMLIPYHTTVPPLWMLFGVVGVGGVVLACLGAYEHGRTQGARA